MLGLPSVGNYIAWSTTDDVPSATSFFRPLLLIFSKSSLAVSSVGFTLGR